MVPFICFMIFIMILISRSFHLMLWKIDEVLVVYDISNSSYIGTRFIFCELTAKYRLYLSARKQSTNMYNNN